MVRKTLMSLLVAGSMAMVPLAYAEGSGSYGSGSSSDSSSGSSSDMGSGSSSGMGSGSSSSSSSAYERECITAAQKRTQRCMDLQKMIESEGGSSPGASGSSTGPSSSGGSDSSSGMGSGSSTTSPTAP